MKGKVNLAEILHRLNAQYGKEILSCANVYDWYSNFSEGHEEVSSLHSANSCMWCEHSLYQRADFEKQILVCGFASSTGVSVRSVEAVTCEHVLFKKVCSRWVPKILIFNEKVQQIAVCVKHLH
jgi:hypothetical protein